MAIAVHGVTLLGDTWLKASPVDLVAPFFMGYRPGFTGLGVIAGWLALLLGLSFYARKWIGAKRWRSLHRATLLVWLMAAVHTLGAGTDAGSVWLQAIVAAPAVGILLMLPARLTRPRRRAVAQAAARRKAAAAGGAAPARRPGPRAACSGPVDRPRGCGPALRVPGPGAGRCVAGLHRRARRVGPDHLVGWPAMSDGIVIAGGGLAAQRCAETLRARGHDGPIRIVCAEPELPYDRPPLSKDLLAGRLDESGAVASGRRRGTPTSASTCSSLSAPSACARPSAGSSWPRAGFCATTAS